jgi:hypothetical protein
LIGSAIRTWLREIPSRLGVDNRYPAEPIARRFVVHTLAKISEAKHGGCLLVLPEKNQSSFSPLSVKYAFQSDIIQRAIRGKAEVIDKAAPTEGIAVDYSPAVDAMSLDRDLEQAGDLVSAMAAVDGAVLLTRDLELVGFGAEIKLTQAVSSDERVAHGMHPSPLGRPEPVPLSNFGMRHRSACRFCKDVPGALALVVSQDGGIRLFQTVDGEGRQWIDLCAEEW